MGGPVVSSILDLIGNTPLVRLSRVTEGLAPKIYAKLEFSNPGGSIKDRVGVAMLLDAERQGLIKPGYVIVEPTSGNTGMGLALAAVLRGYKIVFTVPDKMSRDKIDLLRAFGARVIVTPSNVAQAIHLAMSRLPKESSGRRVTRTCPTSTRTSPTPTPTTAPPGRKYGNRRRGRSMYWLLSGK